MASLALINVFKAHNTIFGVLFEFSAYRPKQVCFLRDVKDTRVIVSLICETDPELCYPKQWAKQGGRSAFGTFVVATNRVFVNVVPIDKLFLFVISI
mmetsp:Transcript_5061/g.7460  ORF Transcript_5061/g.7460 Transcript_5061/m.7460 type:complete len:97 (-) Transcript_5061:269-559(-)